MAVTLNRYTGDGSTKRFAVTFKQYSWTSIVVLIDNVEQSSGYSYDATTEEIVFTTAPIEGAKVTLKRLSDVDLLYKFGQGAAFTGANVDTDFNQYQTAVEEVQNAADLSYVQDALEAETEQRQAADASLQSQITAATPILANEMSVVTWHGQTISNSVDIPDNVNAFSVGPQITIAPGQAVNIGEGSFWTIIEGNVFERDDLYNVTADKLITSDSTFEIEVTDIASRATQETHTDEIGTLNTAVTALTTRMTNEEGKTQPITLGGTGANDAAGARSNLGLGSMATQAASSVAITGGSISGITDLAVADGGTGSSTAVGARSNLGAAASGANTDITSLAGTVAGTDAAAGKIGEVITALENTGVAVTSGTSTNVTSVVLTPGDWDVSGMVRIEPSAGSVTAASGSWNTTSATFAGFPDTTQIQGITAGGTQQLPLPNKRMNITTNTTLYLIATPVFTSGTAVAKGYIKARRMR